MVKGLKSKMDDWQKSKMVKNILRHASCRMKKNSSRRKKVCAKCKTQKNVRVTCHASGVTNQASLLDFPRLQLLHHNFFLDNSSCRLYDFQNVNSFFNTGEADKISSEVLNI
jgi:hypothetical protein